MSFGIGAELEVQVILEQRLQPVLGTIQFQGLSSVPVAKGYEHPASADEALAVSVNVIVACQCMSAVLQLQPWQRQTTGPNLT